MTDFDNTSQNIAVLGAGITGLSAAYFLQQQGFTPLVIERNNAIGGLSRTIEHDGFKFDLGGHRFLTKNHELESFVKSLLCNQYSIVPRSSTIFHNQQFINYPLEPFDTFKKVGLIKSSRFIYDYISQKIKCTNHQDKCLEDWVISNFGRSLYNDFFKGYSEKVWGIDCKEIDSDWIASRIQNLNLAKAIKSTVLKDTRKQYATLTDRFLYPINGIGQISTMLSLGVEQDNLLLSSYIKRIRHNGHKIQSIYYSHKDRYRRLNAQNIISTIPLAIFVNLLDPQPPEPVMSAIKQLRSRDLILVTLMINRERVTNKSWIYFPGKQFPFGRIHEPKNWSDKMTPRGKTSIVAEHFCFYNDSTWLASESKLIADTINKLCQLNIIKQQDVTDALVIKVRNAYPLFETGYRNNCDIVSNYLKKFNNLTLAGRSGAFRYYNIDQAILSALDAVETITHSKVNLNTNCILKTSNDIYGEADEVRAYHTGLVT